MTEVYREPLSMAPSDRYVVLVVADAAGKQWATPVGFIRTTRGWRSHAGLPLPGHLTVLGWREWTAAMEKQA